MDERTHRRTDARTHSRTNAQTQAQLDDYANQAVFLQEAKITEIYVQPHVHNNASSPRSQHTHRRTDARTHASTDAQTQAQLDDCANQVVFLQEAKIAEIYVQPHVPDNASSPRAQHGEGHHGPDLDCEHMTAELFTSNIKVGSFWGHLEASGSI